MPFRNTTEQGRAYYKNYVGTPEGAAKRTCRSRTRQAILSGALVRQPCEKCGNQKAEAHHEDYSKPLEVRWMCRPCHSAEHRKTHCFRGHELTDETMVFIKGRRHSCRLCVSIKNRKLYQAKKAGQQK